MLRETDEKYHQMNLQDYFEGEIKGNLFAVSRIFAEARKQMNLPEYKTFTLALTSVRWKESCPDVLYLDKKTVAKIIGVSSDTDHLSQDLKRSIGALPLHSFLEFADKDKDIYVNGCFITTIAFYKNKIRIRMNPDYLSLFGELDKNYLTMWSSDIFNMRSERAVKLYEVLRENSDTRKNIQTGTISIRFLKELFNIPKDGKGSYVRTNGHFSRPEFEKYVIDPVCDDLAKSEMIQLILQPDGKFYEKIKRGNRVIAYKLYWTISTHPRVASAAEVKNIQEAIDADARVLKVAKDIVNGKKKKPKAARKSTFNGYEHENVDWNAAAAKIMQHEQNEQKN